MTKGEREKLFGALLSRLPDTEIKKYLAASIKNVLDILERTELERDRAIEDLALFDSVDTTWRVLRCRKCGKYIGPDGFPYYEIQDGNGSLCGRCGREDGLIDVRTKGDR